MWCHLNKELDSWRRKKQIGEHIVDHLSERMNEEIVDPVLDEWLAEDESNQEDFKTV